MDLSTLIGIGDEEDLKTSEGIHRLCQQLSQREEQMNGNLENLLSKKFTLEARLRNCSIKHQQLFKASICEDSMKLAEMISHTANLSEKVSAKVRKLDMARMRANEAQKRVHDLIGEICEFLQINLFALFELYFRSSVVQSRRNDSNKG
jgi:hypothetical protein